MNLAARAHLDRDLSGRVIDTRYELTRRLAQGGMGAVYEARNTTTLKRCAVKLLLSDVAPDSAEVKRLILESRSSSVVESDHIVSVFDAGFDAESGVPYLVMELLRGEDLRSLQRRLEVLAPALVSRLALQTAIGLARAHEAGVVHRDIKPANLFLTERDGGDHVLKIVDFGIAKIRTGSSLESVETLTQGSRVIGTPAYMSPEQARGERHVDATSDVWSLGVVMFELLTGRLPYSATSPLAALMTSIATEPLPFVRDRAPWVPPALAEIVDRAMQRDPSARYQHAGALRDALLRFDGDTRITSGMLVGAPSAPGQAPRLVGDDARLTQGLTSAVEPNAPVPPKRRERVWVLLGVAVVASASALWLLRTTNDGATTPPAASVPASSTRHAATLESRPATEMDVQTAPVAPSPSSMSSSARPLRSAAPRATPGAAASSQIVKTAAPEPAPSADPPRRPQLSDAVDEFR